MTTRTLDNSTATAMPTQEMIEAARPVQTWISPVKMSTTLRYLWRRGWRITFDEPALAYNDAFDAHRADLLIYRPGEPAVSRPTANAIRLWRDGRLVLTGPLKQETADTVAALRACNVAEDEDVTNGGIARDPRLMGAAAWLRGR
jgi:hypothetical protein